MSDIPAGWYPDPHTQGQVRYWDGSTWTGHVNNQPSDVVVEKSKALWWTNLVIAGVTVLLALSALLFPSAIPLDYADCQGSCNEAEGLNNLMLGGVTAVIWGLVFLYAFLIVVSAVVAAVQGSRRSAESWTAFTVFLFFPYLVVFAFAWHWVLFIR